MLLHQLKYTVYLKIRDSTVATNTAKTLGLLVQRNFIYLD